MPSVQKVLVEAPARAGFPSIRLERSAMGSFSLYVADSELMLTPSSTLLLTVSEDGWGPVISSEVIIWLLTEAGERTQLMTWREHDVYDPHLIEPTVATLRQVAVAVGCTLQLEDNTLKQMS